MSLMVQPAPLISRAPVPNRVSMPRSGRHPGSAARAILHVHGRYSSHVPERDAFKVNLKRKQHLIKKRGSREMNS